jgi:soluble lytic murein transglycosylase-like protein
MPALTALFIATSAQFSLPPNLLSSLCLVESNHNPAAISFNDGGSNSVGICMVKLSTAQWLGYKGTERSLMTPRVNIYYAAKYLSTLRNRYHGDINKAIIAYNIGHAGRLTRTKYSDKVITQWRLANE